MLISSYLYGMNWFRFKAFIKYYFRAITRFNTHSPFLFEFVSDVLDISKNYYVFEQIETRRRMLLSSHQTIPTTDYGAGSHVDRSYSKSVSQIANSALSSMAQCRMLFNVIMHYRCHTILELGTSLGISSSYMACTSKSAKVYTLEGDAKIADLAKATQQSLGLDNIEVIIGRFMDTLPSLLKNITKPDLIFLDGHHTEQATLQYFDMLINYCHEDSIIILDDIYWSQGMTRAWETIKNHKEVTLTVDLFDFGIVFFRKQLAKENITYIPYQYKPWKIGLFG